MIIKNVNIATPPNVSFLRGRELDKLEILRNVDIKIENGKINKITKSNDNSESNHWVIPGFVDPHTHVIFCGNRENEIDLKKTIGYDGVLKAGGGIYRTVEETAKCAEEDLYQQSKKRVETMIKNGTTALEAKTGYGLTLENENKMLNVMERIEKELGITIKKTLLAHVVPKGMNEREFIPIFEEMIDKFLKRIDYVDIFVDEGAFSPTFAHNIFHYANEKGIPGRVHLNEIRNTGGIETLRNLRIDTYDHMVETRPDESNMLNSIIGFLPFTLLTLRKDPRIFEHFKENDKIISLGSDISPNTYNLSMLLTLSISRQLYPFKIEELINMATINSAYSLGIQDEEGSVHVNKFANLLMLNSSFRNIGYIFGEDLVEAVFIKGEMVKGNTEINLIE